MLKRLTRLTVTACRVPRRNDSRTYRRQLWSGSNTQLQHLNSQRRHASVSPFVRRRDISSRPNGRIRGTALTSPWLTSKQATHHLTTTALVSYLTPPAVFVGLVLTLWAYKCLMMVIVQNKIIYMPSVPPFSRSEKLETYARECKPVRWREESIRSIDGTRLSLAVGECSTRDMTVSSGREHPETKAIDKHIVIVYFQGNASSLPPRTPMLSNTIQAVCKGVHSVTVTLIAVSYRGFWTSSGRANQRGIEMDAEAAIRWAHRLQQSLAENSGELPELVLWGQSIGAGVATQAAANLLKDKRLGDKHMGRSPGVDALVLETPFTSVRNMLVGLYPQKWLPYRYLWPFLRSWWDNEQALQTIAKHQTSPKLLILNAENDEVVPHEHSEQLAQLASSLGFDIRKSSVKSALHHEVMLKGSGKAELAKFLQEMVHS